MPPAGAAHGRTRQAIKRRAEPSSLSCGVEPVIDRVPVHSEVTRHALSRLLPPEVLAQHVQRDAIQPWQRAAAVVGNDARGSGQGCDESFGEQIFGCWRSGAPRQVAEHGVGMPLIEARLSVPAGEADRREAPYRSAYRLSCPSYAAGSGMRCRPWRKLGACALLPLSRSLRSSVNCLWLCRRPAGICGIYAGSPQPREHTLVRTQHLPPPVEMLSELG
jgi:hypothetical protein